MKWLIVCASIFGFSGLILDAWVAHGLKKTLLPSVIESLQTAVRYQMGAALFLLLVAALFAHRPSFVFFVPALFSFAGILFFCGSIYMKCLFDIAWAAQFAPWGGIAFMLSWLSLGFCAFRM